MVPPFPSGPGLIDPPFPCDLGLMDGASILLEQGHYTRSARMHFGTLTISRQLKWEKTVQVH